MSVSRLAPLRLLPAGLLICALLTVQTGGLLHAVEHWFHLPDQSCQAYLAGERLGQGLLASFSLPVLAPVFTAFVQPVAADYRPACSPVFRARAPPVHA
jgi:hypothetical protein